ncbi:hypothetical protein BLNAU_13853 [Blattamonas nauphoetae]|uniref:Uncharacterized protein n=1 Tax=Blattamonas nauphoetae TaxID=2049346 RepID=A0ABQ9XKV4_9EUKA|nr:hypothetical protein BLNAU_13853 [Blattamonas nauphoetae]
MASNNPSPTQNPLFIPPQHPSRQDSSSCQNDPIEPQLIQNQITSNRSSFTSVDQPPHIFRGSGANASGIMTRSKTHARSLSQSSTPRSLPFVLRQTSQEPVVPVFHNDKIDQHTQKLAQIFVSNFVFSMPLPESSNPQSTPSDPPCRPCSTRLSNLQLFQTTQINPLLPQTDFDNFVGQMMSVLSSAFRIRRTELLIGLVLFENVCITHWTHPQISLIRNNLHATLLVCVMLAHKCSSDTPIRNEFFSSSFGVPLFLLNELEAGILELREWNLNVSHEQYVFMAAKVGIDSG